MKRRFLTIMALICVAALHVNAQNDVENVGAEQAQETRNQTYYITLGNVQYAHHNEKLSVGDALGKLATGVLTGNTQVQATKYEDDVKNAIIKGLSSAYRFRFNDGLLRITDVAGEGNLVADAIITNIQAKSSSRSWRDKEDKLHVDTWYTGIAEAILTLKDAKTGEIIANPTVGGWGSGNSHFETSDKAVRDAINRLSNRITAWLNKYRPLQANIIEGATTKKDKQKEVYIDLGSSEGAYEGLHMGVFEVKKIAGREAKSQIGKLKIEAVEGDDISRCKVQSGGKDIKTALEAGEKLRVISID